jgi:GT2 family glycosyltransferase
MDQAAPTPPIDLPLTDCPEVDVVILSWNRPDDTFAAIDSALEQIGVRIRLWVVDQGSEQAQVAALRRLARQDDRVELVELGRNVGVPAGRNAGIRRGSAAWIVSLDNDAVLASPRTVAGAVGRLASSPAVGAVAFRADDHAGGGLDPTSWAYPAALTHQSEPVPVTRFVGVGHAVRRAAFQVVGGYDEGLFFCEEELDLSYRLIAHGYRIVYDPAVVVRHKVSPEERVGWDGRRLFYQVRNAVLVPH